MKIEEILVEARKGLQIVNKDWNGVQQKGKIMYVTVQEPDKNSKNTEPYFMMYVGTHIDGGWKFKRFPWLPSQLDLFSENWEVRKEDKGSE